MPSKFVRIESFGATRARKAHACDGCRRTIAPGEIYYLGNKNGFLGAFHGPKLCGACFEALKRQTQSRQGPG